MATKITKTERTEFERICTKLHFCPDHFARIPTRPRFWMGEVEVEPEHALHLLGFNTKNRKPKKRAIDKYGSDMKSDLWNERTHESLAFSWSPKISLKDGQNRLMSIVESNTAVRLLIAIGVNDDAAAAIDTGAVRNPQDAAIFLDQDGVTGPLTAALRAAEIGTTSRTLSNLETLGLYETYKDGLTFMNDNLPKVANITTLAMVRGAIVRAYMWYTDEADKKLTAQRIERLKLFCQILGHGQYGEEENRVAMQLRDRLGSKGMKGKSYGQVGRNAVYLLTEAAIVKFMERACVKQLKSVAVEQFPFDNEA